MKLKQLISDLSQQTGVPAGDVRKVVKAMSQQLQTLIEEQDSLRIGDLVCKSATVPAKSAIEGMPSKPERKIGRLVIRPRKQKVETGWVA